MKKSIVISASLSALLFLLSLYSSAQNYTMQHGHAEVQGKAPASKYTGVSDELTGEINTDTKALSFKLRLQSIDTRNKKRNQHMYQTLDVAAHPYATFEGTITSGFDAAKEGRQEVTARGKFTIHGVTKEIEVHGTLERSGEKLVLHASFPVNITEYGMERPHILSYRVEDKHVITVSGKLDSKQ